jgi:hypothetical protein
MRTIKRTRAWLLPAAIAASACTGEIFTGDQVPPPAGDVTTPFPIGHELVAGAPATYRGLPLDLIQRTEPSITPVDGVIGVVCIGMSNSNQECSALINALRDGLGVAVNPAVRVVNCAVGGHALEKWNDPAFDATLWDACINSKLPAANVRPDQVLVLWHKAAHQFATGTDLYPAANSDYYAFQASLTTFAQRVAQELPAVRAVYTTSRSYGGFSSNPSRGEPMSYEEGHALNTWLAGHATVAGVWYGWGPYIWAGECGAGLDGVAGLCYVRNDYVADGVHPSESGKAKVVAALHARLMREGWYRGD